MTRLKTYFLLLLILPFPVFAQTAEVIGRVLQTAGTAQAIDVEENTRTLSRRSEIFQGDTVVTGVQGFAQIRMADGAMLALKEDTSFTFAEYSFDADGNTPDSAVMQMVRGGFRTISGSIGDDDDDTYRIETPFAVIGVRGTTHEAVISFGSLFTGVYDGGTTVSNDLGSLDTGLGGDFDYAVTTQGQPPQGLLQQPGQLGQINLNAGIGDDGDDDGADDNGGQGNDQDNGDGNQADNNGGDGNDGGGNDNGAGGNDGGNDTTNFDGLAGPAGGNNTGGAPTGSTARTGGAAATPPTTPTGTGNNGGGTTDTSPVPGGNTDQAINPLNNLQNTGDISNPGENLADTDDDGVPDNIDAFPFDPTRTTLIDTDGDGVDDRDDAFPEDPTRTTLIDSDGDGVDDRDDAFPDDPDRSELIDLDGDGVDDRDDAFPDDPDESVDADGDGVGANADPDDENPDIPGTGGGSGGNGEGEGEDEPEPPVIPVDSDGDGVNDDEDAFPDDPTEDTDTDGDGVGDNADQFPLDPSRSQITALLSPAQIAGIQASGRRGFTLSRSLYEDYEVSYPAIYHGAATDGSSGNPLIIVDNIAAGIFAPFTSFDGRSAQPYFIFDSTANVSSSSLGFTDFNASLGYDVQWGSWSSSQGLRAYTQITDNSANFVPVPYPMLWVTAQATDFSLALPALPDPTGTLYFGEDNVIGGSTLGFLTDFFAFIDFNFSSGMINDGRAGFCIGSLNCNSESDQHWEFDIAGSISGSDDKTVLGYPLNGEINKDSSNVDIYGVISGLFSGNNAKAFVGGLNIFSEIDSMYSDLEEGRVDAIFLLEREDRFTGTNVGNILNSGQEDAFLLQPALARNIFGFAQPTSGNPANILFIDDLNWNIFKDGSGGSGVIDRINEGLTGSSYDTQFKIDWERWGTDSNPLPLKLFENQFDDSVFVDESFGDALLDRAYFVLFDPSHLRNLRGTFNDVLAFIGEDEDGRLLTNSALTMSFDVNFTAPSMQIDNGQLIISVPDDLTTTINDPETWEVLFNGTVGNDGDVQLFVQESTSMGTTDLWIGGDVLAASTFNDFESNIQGAFVDDGDDTTPSTKAGFLNSFYFRANVDDPAFTAPDALDGNSGQQSVFGVALVGSNDIEVRLDDFAELDMSRLGLVVPWEESIVYGALATTEVNTPIFADNTLSVPTDPFTLPASGDINYVFLNRGADVSKLYNGVGVYNEIILGKWTPGSNGNVVNLTNEVDSNEKTEYFNDVFWTSVSGGGELLSPYITTPLTYGHKVEEPSFMGESSAGTIKGVKAHFDASNFLDIVTDGVLSVCAGGSDPGSCSDDSTIFTINFIGEMANGTFTADTITSMTIKHPDGTTTSPTINGELEGLFTAKVTEGANDLYDAFVGGFSFSDASMNKLLAGTFVIEREDRVNSSEISDISKFVLAVDTGDNTTDTFYNATSSPDSSLRLFAKGDSDLIIKHNNDSGAGTLTSIAGGALNPGSFRLTWAFMLDALFMPDNLILGHPGNSPGFSSAAPLFWAHFDKVIPPSNLIGTYRSILQDAGPAQLPFLGAFGDTTDPAGTYGIFNQSGNSLDVSFDVDFSLSSNNISNGSFSASIDTGGDGNDSWVLNAGFGGEVKDNNLKFNLVDAGSNTFGTFTPGSGSGIPIDSASLNGSFVNKLSDSFEGEGVVGGFSLNAGGSSGSFLDGLFLAGIEDETFLDSRLDGLDPLETDPDDPKYNGLVMIGNWHNESSQDKIYPSIVANADTTPVFMNDWDGNFSRVFKKVDATGGNTFSLTGYDGVKWGIWENVDPLNGPSAIYSLDGTSFDDFPVMPWLVVPALDPDSEVTAYDGFINYGFTRAYNTHNSWGATLSALNVSLGLDFLNGNINDGTINLCFGGSGCGSAEEAWHGHFAAVPGSVTFIPGQIDQGVMPLLNVTGSTNHVDGTSEPFYGDIGGFLTGFVDTSSPYNGLAGGFNLTTGSSSEDRSVSGTFLSEKETRLSSLDMNYIDGFARGALMKPDGTVLTGLSGIHSSSSPSSVFFIDESTANNTVWKFGAYYHADMIHWNQFSDSNSNSLDFGIWNGITTAQTSNLDDSVSTPYTGPVPWVNYIASDFSGLNLVRFGEGNSYIYGDVSFDSETSGFTPITSNDPGDFNFSFDVDPATGDVLGHLMTLTKAQSIEGVAYTFIWEFELNPNNDVTDGVAMFNLADFDSATLTVKDASLDVVASSNVSTAIVSGAISADRSSTWNQSHIGGSVLLESTVTVGGFVIDTKVLGDLDIFGYYEDRLTQSDLLAMENNLGIFVKRSSDAVSNFHLSNGNNSDLKITEGSITDSNIDNHTKKDDILFDWKPVSTLSEETTTLGAVNNTPGFNVGWGPWTSTKSTDHNGVESSNYHAEPVYWLSAKETPIGEISNGFYRYGNNTGVDIPGAVLDKLGEGTHGNLTDLAMSFEVNFGTGAVNAGLFEAVLNDGSTDTTWFTKFGGTVNGATALMDSFSESTIDASPVTMSGEIRGVFTGTGADTNHGFAAGFSLTDSTNVLNGVGLINSRTEFIP